MREGGREGSRERKGGSEGGREEGRRKGGREGIRETERREGGREGRRQRGRESEFHFECLIQSLFCILDVASVQIILFHMKHMHGRRAMIPFILAHNSARSELNVKMHKAVQSTVSSTCTFLIK